MPDPIETTEEPVTETAPETAVVEPPAASDEVEKWKALARKNEARAKENAEKAKRLDELEDANRSELEKLQAQLASAQKSAAEAEAARLRASIAAKHGVPEALLTGSNEEALEEAASALLAFKGTPPSTPSSDGQGKQGDPVSDAVKQLTREDIQSMKPEQIVAAREAGQLKTLLSGGR